MKQFYITTVVLVVVLMLILGCASQPAPAVPTAPATQLQTPAVPVATSNTTTTAAPTVISQPPVANPG